MITQFSPMSSPSKNLTRKNPRPDSTPRDRESYAQLKRNLPNSNVDSKFESTTSDVLPQHPSCLQRQIVDPWAKGLTLSPGFSLNGACGYIDGTDSIDVLEADTQGKIEDYLHFCMLMNYIPHIIIIPQTLHQSTLAFQVGT